MTGVVSGHVGTSFTALRAMAGEQPCMVAGEQAVEAAKDREPQTLDRDL
jgi:hypothetical protein